MTLSQFCVARLYRQIEERDDPEEAPALKLLRPAIVRYAENERDHSEPKAPLLPLKMNWPGPYDAPRP